MMFGPAFDYNREASTVSEMLDINSYKFVEWDRTVILPDGRTGYAVYGNRRFDRVYVKIGEGENRPIVSLTSAEADACLPLGACSMLSAHRHPWVKAA